MRLFIALDCSSIEKELKEIQDIFPDDGLKKVKVFHLTLKFLGDVDETEVIRKKLSEVKFEPIDASLSSLGVFPKLSHPNVVWVGLEPKDQITRLQEKIESVLPDFKTDKRFVPHITLARIRNKVGDGFYKALKTEVEPIPIKFNSFHLIKSTLTPDGPVYEIIESYS